MESITFQCKACGADYDLGLTHFLERPNALKCPNCGARPNSNRCHSLAQALDDLLSAMAAVQNKVSFEVNFDNTELPPPYGSSEEDDVPGLVDDLDDDDDDDDFDDDDDSGFGDFDEDDADVDEDEEEDESF